MNGFRMAAATSLAIALGVTGVAEAKPSAGKYTGTTSQTAENGEPYATSLKVNRRGTAIRNMRVAYEAPCKNDNRILRSRIRIPGPVRIRDNALRGKGPLEIDLGDGRRGKGTFRIGLAFTRGGVKGTWRLNVSIIEADGTKSNTCRSGPIEWSASRG